MASRLLHLAIGKQLENRINRKDMNRFMIGQVLPDAIIHTVENHKISHYKAFYCNEKKTIMDFALFRKQFKKFMLEDSLYLGYYFHLIQDALYRKFLYSDYELEQYRGPEFQKILHKDYVILNDYLIAKYGLTNNLMIQEEFYKEKINEIYPFVLNDFILSVKNDFSSGHDGDITYFTETMADEYIDMCVMICEREMKALIEGGIFLNPYDFSWNRK